jgi:SAM-dependent methyltransferase
MLSPAADPAPGGLRCRACGVVSAHRRPSEEELEAAYAGWYRPATGRFSGPLDALLSRTRARLAGRIDRIAPEGAVLDVGAGDGGLLDALAARGRPALGLERHSERPDVRDVDIDEVDGTFAAVVMWHSLEHLPEPGRALAAAARALGRGGILIVAAPNSASLQATTFGERWFALDLPRHLSQIPARALVERLGDEGLKVTRVSHLRGGQVLFGWVHGLVRSLPAHPDLYDAIRRPEARQRPVGGATRVLTVAAGLAVLPVAVLLTAAEVVLRRGGTVYVEAQRA